MPNLYKILKRQLQKIRQTVLHPQWFVYHQQAQHLSEIAQHVQGKVLDIGCAEQPVRPYLSSQVEYIGLDYYSTAVNWYATRPMLYGDAQALPIATESIDTVLLLDVLEHLPSPNACLQEIYRVLKPHGKCIIQIPFLYPIHDAPLDFQRWTSYGLERQFSEIGFKIQTKVEIGSPLQTAALLMNIALSKTVLNWIQHRSPAVIFSLFIPPLIVLINMSCWLLSHMSVHDEFMPHSYRCVLEKTDML
jgi:SAM-dependent methyltransferase